MKRKPLAIATCCLAGSLIVATPVFASPVAGVSEMTSVSIQNESSTPIAGVSLALANCLENSTIEQASSVENVTSDDKKVSSASEEEKDAKKKKSEYENLAVAQVNDYVNIRKKPDENSEYVGKLYSNSVGSVIKKKGDWYKIKSGSVVGFVKAKYVTVGDEELLNSASKKVATVQAQTLKVREEASGDSDTLDLVAEGQELKVTSLKDYKDGWVKVSVGGKKGYVSSEYVEVTKEYTYAESREEEEARIAAEEAAKKAEEEAKAAEEAAKAAEQQAAASTTTSTRSAAAPASTSSNSNNTSTPASSSNNTSAAEESEAPAETTEHASSSGQAVVNYACQFVGNPYVYGGSSLTNGTDCSGFVMSVYAHFGVSLPHSSSALRGVGRAVSYDQKQPGDIICYNGHVAIYIGNNTIVHASNPSSGIKYSSPANYRSVVAVRRIF